MRATLTKLAQTIEAQHSILTVGHEQPDGDVIGSMLALKLALEPRGHELVCASPTPVPEQYRFLPHADTIVSQVPPRPFDLGLLLDCTDRARAGALSSALHRAHKLVSIDHHAHSERVSDLDLRDPEASATAVLIYLLLEQLQIALTPDIATCLYCAIGTDTGFFRFANTNAQALEICARLVAAGARPDRIAELSYQRKPLSAFRLLGRALAHTTIELDGRVAVAALDTDDYREAGALPEQTEGIIDQIKMVDGALVAVLLKREQPGLVRVSLRSKPPVDVAAIARQFGGGGHPRAAGCDLCLSLPEARSTVLRTLEQHLAG